MISSLNYTEIALINQLFMCSKLDGINIQWNPSGSPMDYGSISNYGPYMANGGLSLDVSPTDLKSISAYSGGGGGYIGQGVQFSSVSPASQASASWYNPSDGNIHILQTGEVLRKVDQGKHHFL